MKEAYDEVNFTAQQVVTQCAIWFECCTQHMGKGPDMISVEVLQGTTGAAFKTHTRQLAYVAMVGGLKVNV